MSPEGLDGPTLGELVRQVAELKKEFNDGQRAIFDKLDRMDGTYVRQDVYEAQVVHVKDRIAHLENTQQWLTRTVAFVVITGLGTVVFDLIQSKH